MTTRTNFAGHIGLILTFLVAVFIHYPLIRAPEQWLVDLTDPYKVSPIGNVVSNFAYHMLLSDLIRKGDFVDFTESCLREHDFADFQFTLLNGPALETEFRVAGSDIRVKDLRGLLYSEVADGKTWEKYIKQAQTCLGETRSINFSTASVYDNGPESCALFSLLKERYSALDSFRKEAFNPLYIPGLYDEVPSADVYLFVPWGGFRHIAGFANKDNVSKIMLWEYHSDESQIQRTIKYLTKDLRDKNVLILDNSYTGGTLNSLAESVAQDGGKPSRLAIFPKSALSVVNSDYVLIFDRVIPSREIDTSRQNWLREVYKRVLCYN